MDLMDGFDDLVYRQKGRGHLVDVLALVLREYEAGATADGPDGPYPLVRDEPLEDVQVGLREILRQQELLYASRTLGGEGAGHTKFLMLKHHCPHVGVVEFDEDGCREDPPLGIFGGLASKVGRN